MPEGEEEARKWGSEGSGREQISVCVGGVGGVGGGAET